MTRCHGLEAKCNDDTANTSMFQRLEVASREELFAFARPVRDHSGCGRFIGLRVSATHVQFGAEKKTDVVRAPVSVKQQAHVLPAKKRPENDNHNQRNGPFGARINGKMNLETTAQVVN